MLSRKVINRSGRNYRVMVPSQKMGRLIHCESILESEAVKLFERSTLITTYCEQPILISYEHQNKVKKYYPDFLLWADGEPIYVEVKPLNNFKKKKIHEKFVLIKKHFEKRKLNFITLNEVTILEKNALEIFEIKVNIKLMEGY